MIDTRFDTSIDLRGEIENYRQVALIKYYKMLLEIDPKKDRLTLLAVLRCIDKLERHSQERKRPRCDRKKMQADGTLAWHYQKRNQLFRKAGLYDIESTQYLVDHEEIFDTPEEREERERFEACRREALRKQEERKNEENEKAASETASTPENRKRIRFIRKKTRRHLRIIRKWIREPGKEPYESHRYTGISTQSPFASFRQYLVRNLRKNSDR